MTWWKKALGGPKDPKDPGDSKDRPDLWPKPLREAAYYGPIGDIVKALAPQTEADPTALLVQMLVMFGNVIGRSAHFKVGMADRHYTNLFVGIVGVTSKGRKGISRGLAQQLFNGIDEGWAREHITAGLSSGEGLIWAVRDKIEKTRAMREGGKIVNQQTTVEDTGITDKRLLVIEPELASTLKVMSREGNTLSAMLRQAWDGYNLRALTKTTAACATEPHISVVGHITSDELRKYLDATECANGFGNRFLWVCVKRANELPEGGVDVDLEPHLGRLHAAITHAKDCDVLVRTRSARIRWHQVYSRLSRGRPGLLGAMTGRSEAQAMRLAVLYALSDNRDEVDLPHLLAGLELWRYCFESARYLFGGKLGDSTADAILGELQAVYPESLTRTDIHHKMGRNRQADELVRALRVLHEHKLAEADHDRSDAGRLVERWVACPEGDYLDDQIPDVDPLSEKVPPPEQPPPAGFVQFVDSSIIENPMSPVDSDISYEFNELDRSKAYGSNTNLPCNTSDSSPESLRINESNELSQASEPATSKPVDIVFAGVTYREMDVVNWLIGAMVVNKGQPMQESELAHQVGIDAELIHQILCRYPHLFLNLASEDQEDCWVRRVLIDGGAQ